jgi:hypothetical protein
MEFSRYIRRILIFHNIVLRNQCYFISTVDTAAWKTRMSVYYLGFEVFIAVVMKNIIFGDMMPCSPFSVNRRFGGTYRLHLQGWRNKFRKKQASMILFSLPSVDNWRCYLFRFYIHDIFRELKYRFAEVLRFVLKKLNSNNFSGESVQFSFSVHLFAVCSEVCLFPLWRFSSILYKFIMTWNLNHSCIRNVSLCPIRTWYAHSVSKKEHS